ncbi:hypothetical protein VKT23_020503 [Stygiomarasmius scandens]|uniref:Uncharacterized protein n=1 Tax=Marasmiellus scandens TaxID=2682957 RepID=A0ABR1IKN5_9AGAR
MPAPYTSFVMHSCSSSLRQQLVMQMPVRVFIAHGNAVTVEYIIKKGSAVVEVFRDISHLIANYFGDPDRSRRHKEAGFLQDIRAVVEELERLGIHRDTHVVRFVAAPLVTKSKKAESVVFDVQVRGMEIWAETFADYVRLTTYDPRSKSYPLGNPTKRAADKGKDDGAEECDNGGNEHDALPDALTGTVFDDMDENPLDFSNYVDLHGDNGLGGGDEFLTGVVLL